MRRFRLLLVSGWAVVIAGCSSFVQTLLNGPADLEERRRATATQEKEAAAKNVLHFTDTPTSPGNEWTIGRHK